MFGVLRIGLKYCSFGWLFANHQAVAVAIRCFANVDETACFEHRLELGERTLFASCHEEHVEGHESRGHWTTEIVPEELLVQDDVAFLWQGLVDVLAD